MKKILSLVFALVLLISFTSCEKDILDDINLENSIEDQNKTLLDLEIMPIEGEIILSSPKYKKKRKNDGRTTDTDLVCKTTSRDLEDMLFEEKRSSDSSSDKKKGKGGDTSSSSRTTDRDLILEHTPSDNSPTLGKLKASSDGQQVVQTLEKPEIDKCFQDARKYLINRSSDKKVL